VCIRTATGLKVSVSEVVTHLHFVDDVMLFGAGTLKEMQEIKDILTLFCKATGMELNNKSSIRVCELDVEVRDLLRAMFSIEVMDIESEIKYLVSF
jgi:hypothetical protein